MKKANAAFLFLLLLTVALISCNSNRSSNNPADRYGLTEKKDTLLNEIRDAKSVIYLFPSPGEILNRFDGTGIGYESGLTNPAENASAYMTTKARALNLGVYISDMAYCAVLNRTNEAVDYLDVINDLSEEAGVATSAFSSLVDRARTNIGNKDSLVVISTDLFMTLLEFLENGGKNNTIALISSGAYIESMYLTIMLAGPYSDDNKILRQVAEMKYPFDNLLQQIQTVKDDPNVASMISYMETIKGVFDDLGSENYAEMISKNEDGSITVMGGAAFTFNEQNYSLLKSEVLEIRKNIVSK
ncbi:MAG: hypothetical protein ACOYXB_02365 [Bacteroidota bacterium]